MSPKPLFVSTTLAELHARAGEFCAKGWRFIQCCASRDGEQLFELLYSFTDDATNEIANLVLTVAANDEVPSVGDLFPCAFMFENEMHDLFGINVVGITLDYRGGFYHLHIPAPMAVAPERPSKKPAAAKAAAGQEA